MSDHLADMAARWTWALAWTLVWTASFVTNLWLLLWSIGMFIWFIKDLFLDTTSLWEDFVWVWNFMFGLDVVFDKNSQKYWIPYTFLKTQLQALTLILWLEWDEEDLRNLERKVTEQLDGETEHAKAKIPVDLPVNGGNTCSLLHVLRREGMPITIRAWSTASPTFRFASMEK